MDTTDQAIADTLFGSTATLVSSYGPSLADAADQLMDVQGWTRAQRDVHIAEMARIYHDANIAPEQASRLHALVAHHTRVPADDVTATGWTIESRRALREHYPDDFEARLATAREFIAQRPALASLLNTTGIGSHPDVVLALSEQPHALRVAPSAPTTLVVTGR